MTISGSDEFFVQCQILDEKNCVVTASVRSHLHELSIFLLLQCLPVLLASHCVVFKVRSAMVQLVLTVEVGEKAIPPMVSHKLNNFESWRSRVAFEESFSDNVLSSDDSKLLYSCLCVL